jgi:hypothetical protein
MVCQSVLGCEWPANRCDLGVAEVAPIAGKIGTFAEIFRLFGCCIPVQIPVETLDYGRVKAIESVRRIPGLLQRLLVTT